MRPFLYVLSFLAVIASGFWAYRENYATQEALKQVSRLNRDIASLREGLTLQRAEWAYLNRPDRLRDLVVLNFDKLGLLPLEPEQMGNARQVAYPRPPAPPAIEGATDTSATPGKTRPAAAAKTDKDFP
ncbi:MAG: cell division protein FtsL [Paracoccaceae bacterium]